MVKALDLPGVPPAPDVPADDPGRKLVLARRESAVNSLEKVNFELEFLSSLKGFDSRKKYLNNRRVQFTDVIAACDVVLKGAK